jgi:8-oxo-dGTP pyrophosphatase MutT (NUDIX family)
MKRKIIAAGGLIVNEKNELLMIFRRKKWDLPKGKLDEGESIENCAIREVKEETGLTPALYGGLIGLTYHDYFDKLSKEEVTKETHWFGMRVFGIQKPIPQAEEEITEVKWVKKNELGKYLKATYPNVVEIIKKWMKR